MMMNKSDEERGCGGKEGEEEREGTCGFLVGNSTWRDAKIRRKLKRNTYLQAPQLIHFSSFSFYLISALFLSFDNDSYFNSASLDVIWWLECCCGARKN